MANFQQNLNWLAGRLPQLQLKLVAPEPHILQLLSQRIPEDQQKISNELMMRMATEVLKACNAESAEWVDKPKLAQLPLLAVNEHPELGLFIIHALNPDRTWLIETPRGLIQVQGIPEGTKFCPILPRYYEEDQTMTARHIFYVVLSEQKKLLVFAGLAAIFINLLALISSFYSMQVYDRVIPTQGISTLIALTVGVMLGAVFELMSKFARSSIMEHVIKSADTDLSHKIFERLMRVRMDQFPPSVGTLSAQIRSYEMIRSFGSSALLYLLIDVPFALFFMFVIFMIGGPGVASVPLIFFILSVVVGIYHRKKIDAHAKESLAAANKKLGLLVETIDGAEAIKSAGASWHIQAKWNNLSRACIEEDAQVRHLSESASFFAGFFQQISYVLMIAIGAYVASTGNTLTTGGLIACSILSGKVLNPVGMIPGLLVQWAHAKTALQSIEMMFSLKQDHHDVERPLAPDTLKGSYILHDVAFAYPSRPQTIVIPGLRIQAGEKIGVIGQIGCGKSTLLKLLSGMYLPQRGRILINNLDIPQVARSALAKSIGYLPQEIKLFSGTVRDNLLYGLAGVSDQALLAICTETGLSESLASNPKGLDMTIAEGGGGLSGGQRQLAALTRIVLSNPSVWLLDEPTASMDDYNERKTLRMLQNRIQAENTLILVTHKPALLEMVDRLIVMGPGSIVLDGPKETVLNQLRQQNAAAQQNRQAS